VSYQQVEPGTGATILSQAGHASNPDGQYDVTVTCSTCNADRYISSGSLPTTWYCVVCDANRRESRRRRWL
jgi:hypothetical protein